MRVTIVIHEKAMPKQVAPDAYDKVLREVAAIAIGDGA